VTSHQKEFKPKSAPRIFLNRTCNTYCFIRGFAELSSSLLH